MIENTKPYPEMKDLMNNVESPVGKKTSGLKVSTHNNRTPEPNFKFLSLVHDLRRPLTCIKGLTGNLLDEVCEPLTPRQQMYLERVYGNAERLERMTDNLLYYRGISAETLPSKINLVNLPELVKNVVEQFQVLGKKKNQTIQVEIRHHDLTLKADEDGLYRILTNLLDNAMKYTPANGTIRVTVEQNHNGSVALTVKDTGPGVAPDALPHLTEPFWQGQTSQKSSERGLGLGLFIVKSLVELYKGKMAIDSHLGEGTTISVMLPLD